MKKVIKAWLAGLFVLFLLLGTITVLTIIQAQSNGRLINYCGIVRGATQRLVKLELADQPNDGLVSYLDCILAELSGKQGEYGLPVPKDEDYQRNLSKLGGMWEQLKEDIYLYRTASDDDNALLADSESYFDQANETVFAAENYAADQTHILLTVSIVMLCVMLLTWLFIFWAASRKMLLLEMTNKELSELAHRDPLTGALKLERFKEDAQKIIDLEPHGKLAIVYTDFADFKYINDVFGYAYGDSILSRYGEILRDHLQKGELFGRVSADNFVLLLRYEKKEDVAVRQRQADEQITGFMHASYDRHSIPTCCGICCLEDLVEDLKIEGLLDKANFARKTVKNGSNRNYVYYNESIRDHLRKEKELESRMLEAMEKREFEVFYQPKIRLDTGEIACAEALVRWREADGSIIGPDQFIPVFEQNFLINRLDQYVFEDVCRWQRHLIDSGKRALPVSVNVSRLQFYDRDFVLKYVEIRDKYKIPRNLLEIEFTESIVFDNQALLIQIVRQLKEAGFLCSIDDFGKGYSSLSILKSLPVDVVKIDRLFFSEGDDRERDLALVKGIIEMLKKFQIRTVAEGIEELDLVGRLKEFECDYVQGYVFYRPMPEKQYEKLLDTQNEAGKN